MAKLHSWVRRGGRLVVTEASAAAAVAASLAAMGKGKGQEPGPFPLERFWRGLGGAGGAHGPRGESTMGHNAHAHNLHVEDKTCYLGAQAAQFITHPVRNVGPPRRSCVPAAAASTLDTPRLASHWRPPS